ncbi:hypothetical protein ABGB18_19625 [Nonomuraea sp. B12E4]
MAGGRAVCGGIGGPSGRPVACSSLALWPARDDMEDLYGDPLAMWRTWAGDVTGHAIDCGHHTAEEAPHELAKSLLSFLQSVR